MGNPSHAPLICQYLLNNHIHIAAIQEPFGATHPPIAHIQPGLFPYVQSHYPLWLVLCALFAGTSVSLFIRMVVYDNACNLSATIHIHESLLLLDIRLAIDR